MIGETGIDFDQGSKQEENVPKWYWKISVVNKK